MGEQLEFPFEHDEESPYYEKTNQYMSVWTDEGIWITDITKCGNLINPGLDIKEL